MKKLLIILILIIICLGVIRSSHSASPFLSDENMLKYENVILYSIIDNMDFLASTKPKFLEKHLSALKYIPDGEMETVQEALEDMAPKQTYEKMGGDCEDLTIYTIARFFQFKMYDVGFMLLRNPTKVTEQNSQHIVAVALTTTNEILVYDLVLEEHSKRLPLELYLKMWKVIAPEFDAYRIHWFFCPASLQPKMVKIK